MSGMRGHDPWNMEINWPRINADKNGSEPKRKWIPRERNQSHFVVVVSYVQILFYPR